MITSAQILKAKELALDMDNRADYIVNAETYRLLTEGAAKITDLLIEIELLQSTLRKLRND